MKTKLLISLAVFLAVFMLKATGQEAFDNFDNYVEGPLKTQGTAENGWAGGWSNASPFSVVAGDLGYTGSGKHVESGNGVQMFRELSETWTAASNPVYWLSFTGHAFQGDDWGGLSLYLDGSELRYIGNNGGFWSLGDDYNRSATSMTEMSSVLVKLEMSETGNSKAYLWVNYTDTNEPANESAEGSKDFSATGGFNKIRLGNGNYKIAYDAIKFSKTSFFDANINVEGVVLNKSNAGVGTLAPLQLSAKFFPSYATNKEGSWTSSDESIATVSNGVVTGKVKGTVTITFTSEDGDKQATCEVVVYDGAVPETSLTLSKEKVYTFAQTHTQLIATVLPDDATNKNVGWTSSNPSVALVDGNGNVTALKEGVSVITATTNTYKRTASCEFTVVKPGAWEFFRYSGQKLANKGNNISNGWKNKWSPDWVQGADVVKDSSYWLGGRTGDVFLGREFITTYPNTEGAVYWVSFKYQNTQKDADATADDAKWSCVLIQDPTNVDYSMKNLFIGSIKGNDRKIGLGSPWGARAATSIEDTLETVIVVKLVMSGKNSNSTAYLWCNPTTDAEPSIDTAISIEWWNVSTDGISKVSLAARAPFETKISDFRFDTKYVPLTKVLESISTDDMDVIIGETKALKVSLTPSNVYNPTVTYTSSDNNIAIISNYGFITGISKGEVTITATADNGQSTEATISVVGNPMVPVSEISFNQTLLYLPIEETITLMAKLLPADAGDVAISWTSSNTNIATVDNLGKVTGVAEGLATITASIDAVKGTCVVAVTDPTGINGEKMSNLRVYPVPASDVLYIQNAENAVVSIHTINGQLVKTIIINNSLTPINTSEIKNGLYLLKVTKNNETIVKKISILK